ncbi:MAG TPA: calcium/sodium antiporter [Oligoflexia bacterium]|nr:calcium/sodium antiporter [Oligoflexia bacterium]HMR25541.1 calcium/sodium antiporter [Oligoflexia bacterium]
MFMYIAVLVLGLVLLIWSADRFVDDASLISKHLGMSPLLIGMIIIGFGTSAPEMVVSAISAFEGNPGIALGNAFGSNITNIALIIGFTAVCSPIVVDSAILKKELPILSLLSLFVVFLLSDFMLSRQDAIIILFVFAALMAWTIHQGLSKPDDTYAQSVEEDLTTLNKPLKSTILSLIVGIVILLLSSRALVWGAVGISKFFGVSDIVIGLTIVAIGTSLPELAASVAAAKKNEPDMVLGNILGSNLFNTLAVIGIAGIIQPLTLAQEILYRDILVMLILTLSLFLFGYGFKKQGEIGRTKGLVLLVCYVSYTTYLLKTVLS